MDNLNLINEVATFIQQCKKYKPDLSDKKINKFVIKNFPNLNFGLCLQVDNILFPEKEYGSYWRSSYNWPKNGDSIGLKKAYNCGFFTFEM
jgi:hypothetical protein